MTYYYSINGEEDFSTEIEDCIEWFMNYYIDDNAEDFPVIVYEFKPSVKAGTYCDWILNDTGLCEDCECGVNNCTEYTPRNGKNGICKYKQYRYIETGREFEFYENGEYKKIKSRRK